MLRLLKQKFCKHDYQLTKTFFDDGDKSLGYKPVEFAIIYCPKCKSQKTVSKFNFDIMNEMKRIDLEYGEIERLEQEIDNQESGK